MTDSTNALRTWRKGRGLNLAAACELLEERGIKISTATLSRIERDQLVPVELLSDLVSATGILARDLRPDLANLFSEVGP